MVLGVLTYYLQEDAEHIKDMSGNMRYFGTCPICTKSPFKLFVLMNSGRSKISGKGVHMFWGFALLLLSNFS